MSGVLESRSTGAGGDLGRFVRLSSKRQQLVVQPRMGFSDPVRMRRGLAATRNAAGPTAGTLTLDSYTRNRDYASVRRALGAGEPLNGFPLVTAGTAVTRGVLADLSGPDFPVQVRHGSPDPRDVVTAMLQVGLTATEGGPISYSLPYGRAPLVKSMAHWREACRTLVDGCGPAGHLETFGGCLLGQLCPPALLVAMSVLEALFFAAEGVQSVSLSYAQQTNEEQDVEAIAALRALAGEFLPAGVDRHVVVYTYMGVFPRSRAGAQLLLEQSARLAVRTGSERLIVKTVAEAHKIPNVADNVEAMELAHEVAGGYASEGVPEPAERSRTYAEARALILGVLNLHSDIGTALLRAFEKGYVDVPFCLHPDNAGRSRSYLDARGRLQWSATGRMPIGAMVDTRGGEALTSNGLLAALSFVEQAFDRKALELPGRLAVSAGSP